MRRKPCLFLISMLLLCNFAFIVYCLSLLPTIYKQRQNLIFNLIALRIKNKKISEHIILEFYQSKDAHQQEKFNVLAQIKGNKDDESIGGQIGIKLLGICQGDVFLVFLKFIDTNISGIYTVGSKIGAVEVIAIYARSVLLDINGRKKILTFETDEALGSKIYQVSDEQRIIKKYSLPMTVIGVAKEVNNLKIKSVFNSDTRQIEGIQLTGLDDKNSIIEKLGFCNNDIISTINEMPIKNVASIMDMASSIRDERLITIGIKRNNMPIILKYYISE